MLRDQIKAFADTGEHPKRQDIDLQNIQSVDIILVPFDDRAVIHRGVFDRAKLIQSPLGDDKPADMLAQMSRKPDDFTNQLDGQRQTRFR